MGLPAVFVRLAGCNLRCDFCDTRYAWEGGTPFTQEELMEAIRNVRREFSADWICLTGGEPFFQPLAAFTAGLKAAGLKIQIETNGTLFQQAQWDWLTLSPKPPDYFIRPEWTRGADEAKLVIDRTLDLDHLRRIRNALPEQTPVLLQPQSQMKWSAEKGWALMRESVEAGMKNIRLTVQLHKILRLK